MWFKKKAYISGYNTNTAYDGTDWRQLNENRVSWSSVPTTPPDAADANKYFYLPAFGFYRQGGLGSICDYGFYWSSTGGGASSFAYALEFAYGYIRVNFSNPRYHGYRVDGFE